MIWGAASAYAAEEPPAAPDAPAPAPSEPAPPEPPAAVTPSGLAAPTQAPPPPSVPSPPAAPPPAPGAAPSSAAPPPPGKKKKDTAPRARFELEARVISGFEYERDRPAGAQTQPGEKEYGFEVQQARVGVDAQLDELRLNLNLELADALDRNTGGGADSPPYVRTVTLEYRFSRALRLTVGRYKRPFSRLALESALDLPLRGRGLVDGLLIEDNQWGDRSVGAMVSGRLELAKLRWYLSFTNPGWSPALRNEGLDVLGRVQLSPAKRLTLGLNGGYKRLNLAGSDEGTSNFAIGGDIAFKVGGAHFALEGSFADLPFETGRPRGFGAHLLADYELPLSAELALQPVVFAELADADAKLSQTESLRLAFGLNLLVSGGFRVMPQLALVRSVGDTSQLNPWLESELFSLVLSLAL